MTVRMWITAVEAASLIWLDEDKQPPVDELRDWLVDHFVALLTATAASGPADRAGRRAALSWRPPTARPASWPAASCPSSATPRTCCDRPPGRGGVTLRA